MELIGSIPVQKISRSRLSEVDFNALEFGKYISDHMLVCDYKNGAWQTPAIVPFGDLTLSPTALALHYGQTVFEGMKAFRMEDGRINLFRLDKHYDRLKKSMERMCMPLLPEAIFREGLQELLRVDQAWIPKGTGGGALYIRPFIFASEAKFGVKVADEYKFIIFTGPVGPAFSRPIKVKVESHYIRAARGGTGYAKCGGNYGGAFFPTNEARKEGYDQVLWTDARDHKFIEESGMMNVMFVLEGQLVTPPLSDSILDGITRDSLLQIAELLQVPHEARPVSVEELEKAFRHHTISEAFGAGTAAVVAPIDTIRIGDIDYQLPSYNDNNIMYQLRNKLDSIRLGKEPDIFGWNDVL